MKKCLFLLICLIASIQGFSQKGTNLYAGVEVGSKGVKLSVVALMINTDGAFSYSVQADTAINTEIIAFTPSAIIESANAAVLLYKKAIEFYKIPDRQIVMVLSSGVVEQSKITHDIDKIEEVKSLILSQITNKQKTIDFLTPDVESRLVNLGTINREDRKGAVVIDVGSGSTKGGYFDNLSSENPKFMDFNFNWGTAKIKGEINKKQPESIASYSLLVNQLVQSIKPDAIMGSFNRNSGIRNQPSMIMGGGISWVIATLMQPDKMQKAFIELNIKDVKDFRRFVLNNYEDFISDSRAKSPEALIEFNKVRNNFDQKSMIAGSALIEAIMQDLNSSSPSKHFYFARYCNWLTGYIVKIKSGEDDIIPAPPLPSPSAITGANNDKN
jgi:hypothetical protein